MRAPPRGGAHGNTRVCTRTWEHTRGPAHPQLGTGAAAGCTRTRGGTWVGVRAPSPTRVAVWPCHCAAALTLSLSPSDRLLRHESRLCALPQFPHRGRWPWALHGAAEEPDGAGGHVCVLCPGVQLPEPPRLCTPSSHHPVHPRFTRVPGPACLHTAGHACTCAPPPGLQPLHTRVQPLCPPIPSVAAPGPLGGAAPTLRPLQPSPWQRSGFINGDKFREGSRRGGRRRRSCAGTWRAAVGAHGDAAHACARGARPGCGQGALGGEHPSPKEAAPCLAAGSFSSSCREGRARAGRWVLCLAGGVERGCARGRPGLLSPVWGGGSATCPVLSTQDSESGRRALFLACH